MVRAPKIVLLLCLLASFLPVRQLMAAEDAVNDVRILIDVSGSMKKNDPKNLRSPALEMLVGLLPQGANAGVWTFAKYVNQLVPHQTINNQWRDKAAAKSNKIHSYGLFTDIEQVLDKATANQKQADPKKHRSVILLSDGLVDISPKAAPNIASRKNILNKLVPRLKKANVAVHTIALADSSDHVLLRDISLATEGWYEQVNNAEQLQRVFLHLFEKVANPESVPLKQNSFQIDDSVSEMTVLVFRKDNNKATELVSPDKARISLQTKSDNVRWRHNEVNFDLVTITEPQAGSWHIDANVDPDNRVMVVTDLKLKTSDLPNNILIGDTLDFDVSLTEKNEVITRLDFLSLVDMGLKHENELTDVIEENLNPLKKEGIYRTSVGRTFQPGRNDIVTTANSGTFERQRRQSINVVDVPFIIDVSQLLDEPVRTHRLILKPDTSLINNETMSVSAMLTADDGNEWPYEVIKMLDDTWQLTIAELQPMQLYTVNMQFKGETVKGRPVFLQAEPIVLFDETPPPKPDVVDEVTDELDTVADIEEVSPVIDELDIEADVLLPEIESEVVKLADDFGVNEEEGGIDDESQKALNTSTLLYGNIILALLVALGLFMWRKQTANNRNPGEQL